MDGWGWPGTDTEKVISCHPKIDLTEVSDGLLKVQNHKIDALDKASFVIKPVSSNRGLVLRKL